ncbi:2OG-Fe(II) oxygenase family oxidoreductase [Durotheca rogersii]|uniref:2OG-Fe(II) oxygenase family oxidoreductase n=1 Tax=Durotheca rogersii TaxID=419775 RepID=UPI002220BEF6|nr:2OG-Fe(II) oxygenase family oxidoreductase [Durotheca rogersii]KAI5865670.1 2OG-Fe(II) oxygenase family oxidoreductase [Durotheca rogersii]
MKGKINCSLNLACRYGSYLSALSYSAYLRFITTSLRIRGILITEPYACEHNYSVEILSIDPLVIYINGFLKEFEIKHLLEVTNTQFDHSYVYDSDLKSVVDQRYRTSQSAMVSPKDFVSICLSERMKSLLGNIQHIDTEPLQVVKYEGGERFRIHMDWFDRPRNETFNPKTPFRSYNRLGSIFAYLEDGCSGGETYFPDIRGVAPDADGDKFTRTETGEGLLVNPRRGNAVFWNNLFMNGSGDPRVAHAGRPVLSGRKTGMNLFSYYYLDVPIAGGESG